jgi:hypothetical protein
LLLHSTSKVLFARFLSFLTPNCNSLGSTAFLVFFLVG